MRIGVSRRIVPVLLLTLLSAAGARAQLRDWQAYPSLRQVYALDASSEAIWAVTTGGLFSYAPASGEVKRYTPVEGLHGVDVVAVVSDDARGVVWVGYRDGVFDRLDPASGDVTSFFDIARADQYSDRGIRRIRVHGDSLFVATSFGLVVFDAARAEVRDTYARLATLETATPVNDALVAPLPDGGGAGLWLATEAGVVYAPADAPNLQEPSAWTLDPDSPSPAGCVVSYDGAVHACAARGAERRAGEGDWRQELVTGSPAHDLLVDGDFLYVPAESRLIRLVAGTPGQTDYLLPGYGLLTSVALGPDGTAWVGDREGGLLNYPPLGPPTGGQVTLDPARVVVPEGPYNNAIRDIALGDGGVVWASHGRVQNNITGIALTAASRRDADGHWTAFVQGEEDLPPHDLISAAVAPDGTYYAASFGGGLVAISPDGGVVTYDDANSTLVPTPGTDGQIYLGDAVPDDEGRVWVTNRASPFPYHVRAPDGTWVGIPYPPGMPTTVHPWRLVIDDFGQKWFTVRQNAANQGAGVVAVATGEPLDPTDDQARFIGQVGNNGTGLPSEDVSALAFDGEERLWIGTHRGLAIIFEPGSAFSGDPSLTTPQWARTADGSSYFLRDLDVNDFAVDPAGQLWIASTTGAWLLNADGDEALVHVTTENSPLFSDNVMAVDVDQATGRVYFATERGLLSAAAEATAPAAEPHALTVAPSPYRPAEHARGVLISGLVAETTVYVLTPDGQRIAVLDAHGGSVRWDGRDARTGEPVTSGVYLVAAVAADGAQTAVGKVAVIR